MTRSFLKHPPQGLDIEQRLTFEAIGFAIDAIDLSYNRLKRQAEALVAKHPNYENLEASKLFVDVWSIVDSGHALIQLLRKNGKEVDLASARHFIGQHQVLRDLRNKMDHLAGNIANISANKKSLPPVYGALSFVSIWRIDEGEPKDFSVVTVTAGSFTKPNHRMKVANPLGRIVDGPVGHFELAAFDYSTVLTEVYSDALAVRKEYETKVADYAKGVIEAAAKEKGLDPTQSLEPAAEGAVVVLNFSGGSDGENSTEKLAEV